ncbi:MAG: hypothetical protein RCO49_04730 [Rickettsia endosymbiont of Argas persicus]
MIHATTPPRDDTEGHRQVKRDVNLSIERLKGMIYRIAVTIYQ